MPNSHSSHSHRIITVVFMAFVATLLLCGTALAGEVEYGDDEKHDLNDPNTTYIIRGDGTEHKSGNYFYVPENKSSEENPLVIVLDNVNRTQAGCDPSNSFITVAANNYVIVKLRGTNTIVGGEQEGVGSNDGMAGIHVSQGAALKVTSEAGDGSTEGALTAKGGGSKYGGAGIGTSYNHATGSVIIAGGTINATGGHCAAGIGSGRDGQAYGIQITGGNVTAQGGDYAAGIGAGDNVGPGEGGDTYDITISGGTINASGGPNGAGIGCSEGGTLRGTILISGGDVTATGGHEGAGIGSGDGAEFCKDEDQKGLVKITGGNINAKGGGNGAGIGGANGSDFIDVRVDQAEGSGLYIKAQGGDNGAGIGSGAEDCDNVGIRLRGGTIEARGGSSGAGIGGANDPGVGTGGDAKVIEIYGTGTVNAYGGSNAAAIGGGYDNEVSDHITIEGDSWGQGNRGLTIVADSGGGTAAGIGSGSEDCGPISIKNANVKAWGDGSAADIGTGGNWGNGGKIPSVTIENCSIETKGKGKSGAGIGAGQGCECKKISIKGSECYGNAIGEGMGVFFLFWSNYGDMDSITIEGSHIEATWDNATGSSSMKGSAAAGIGSCTLGSVGSITIDNSVVTAKGINGGAGIGSGGWGADNYLGFEYIGGEVGSITITDSQVSATGAEPGVQSNSGGPGPDLTHRPVVGGGAGIGGGGNTKCGTIAISWSTVTAKAGKYAAGIGGGGSESVDSVSISSDSEVTATGGEYGAGIGSGGSTSAVTQTVFHADVDTISIYDSKVTATGGKYAAGIGAGCGAAMDTTTADKKDIDYNIHVASSTINAQGGEGGAGIGGGLVGAYTTGGHSGDILLEGKSHITATGGKQGSGVGGGACSDFQGHGGCDNVVINLQSQDDMPTHGTDPSSHSGWLVATGGLGGAGIGAGGYLYHNSKADPIPRTNDTQSITIKGGYIVATGGGDDTDGAGIKTGSGAGIGGGAAGTKLKNLDISGGWVEAHAGNAHAADIGHGGNTGEQDGSDDSSNRFYIYAGTVVADSFGSGATKIIDGGSVTAKLTDAHNSAGTPVYQTTLKTLVNTKNLHQVDVRPPYGYFGIRPVYNDEGYKVYLYLPVTEEDQQTAELYVPGWMDHMHYYGTTKSDNSGWLKMGRETVYFKNPGEVRYGDEVTLELDDEDVTAGMQWRDVTVTGPVELKSVDQATSPGMKARIAATGLGDFSLSAIADGSSDNELFWGSTASYNGTVGKAIPAIDFTEDPSKTYDGKPVTDPSVTVSNGAGVTYSYNTADGAAPKNAGTYKVTATSAETSTHESASVELEFTITPAPTTLALQLSQDQEESTASAKATVAGLVDRDGAVEFTVNGSTSRVDVGDDYTATLTRTGLPAGVYEVTAKFVSSTGNYQSSESSATGDMSKVTPWIRHYDGTGETYGEGGFNLNAEVFGGNVNITKQVDLTYDLVWDEYRELGFDPAVRENPEYSGGSFHICHAGKGLIRITATPKGDAANSYNTAVDYAKVDIAPAQLTVTSYVHEPGKDETLGEATYGKLFGLQTDLRFQGLTRGATDETDTPENFTHGYGTLSAAPLPTTIGASESYEVPILRNGVEKTVGGTNVRVFVSRDYDITYAYEPLRIAKRTIAIKAQDASGVYGGTEPTYAWDVAGSQQDFGCDGLAAWDSSGAVFSTPPTVQRTGGDYRSLGVGTYEGVLVPSGGESANYEVTYVPGNLEITPADVSDAQRIEVKVDDTVYNGREQRQPVRVTDTALWVTLFEGVDYDLRYDGDLVNAGTVQVTVTGKGEYAGFQSSSYRINKARISVVTESAGKRFDGTPLTAPGSMDGVIGSDASFAVTGSQTDAGASPNTYDLSFASEQARANYAVEDEVGTLRVSSANIEGCVMSRPDGVVYNGHEQKQPVTLTLNGEALVDGRDYTLAYTNATDAGTVTVTATGTGNYAGTKSVTYVISPAPLRVETDSASKPYDGTPLTAPGGSIEGLVNGETATLVATGSLTKVGSAPNGYEIRWDGSAKETNYRVKHEDLGTLTVTQGDLGDCRMSQPTDVTFNGREQRQPVELVGADGATLVEGADYTLSYSEDVVNAGTVTVTANGIGDYTGTKATSYAIRPAPTSTYVALAQNGTSAGAQVTVVGLFSATGNVTLTVNDSPIEGTYPVNDSGNGTFVAAVPFANVPEGTYVVKATFAPGSANYEGSTDEASGKKDLAARTVVGETSYNKTFGDVAFNLNMSAESGKATAHDAWSYEVAWDAADALGLEPAVTVDGSGQVGIKHAGSSVIKVTLSDNRDSAVYADATAFVRVNVGKADLSVTSFAWRNDAQGVPHEVTSETYGDLGDIEYGLQYATHVNGQDNVPVSWDDVAAHVTGTFACTPVPTNAAVGTHEISIRNVGEDVEVGGVTVRNAFGSRDYDIATHPGSLEVVQRKLAIRASDAQGVYGTEEPGYTWIVASEADQAAQGCAGLAAWDTAKTVFSAEPTVTRDEAKASGEYRNLSAGMYKDALVVSRGVSTNYDVTYLPGTLVVQPANISDDERFFARVAGTTYNAGEQRQTPEVFDTIFDPERQLAVSPEAGSGDVVASYEGDVVNVGTVNVKLEGRGNYTGTRRVSYDIARAPLTVVTGGDAKVYDGKALTNPSASLSGLIGDQTAPIETTGSITNAGITKNTYAIDWNAGTASESNYQIATEQLGMLAVSKRTVNVTADNKRKVYGEDNPALTFTVAEGGLVNGDTLASLGITPTLTTTATKSSPAGTYPIDFADPQTSTQNYNLEYHPGTLAVTRSKESVVIAAKSAGKVYDGTPLTEAGFEVTGKLAEGDLVTDVVMSADSSLTNVGSQPNRVESYVIRNASGEDVTTSYDDVTLQPGTLVVTKRPVVFMADSDLTRTYDGTEQSVAAWHTREGTDQGLVAGHQTNVTAEGKGMLPGVYPVTVTSAEEVSITDAEGADVTANYQVTCVKGAMRIWPISTQIAITAASATKTYDGSALVDAGFSATAGVLLDGDELQATVEGSATHVTDDGSNKVTSYKVMRGDVDVTSGYTFGTSVNGKLTVTPAQLTVTTDSATKTYDGTPLTAPGSLAGLVGEETATLVTTGSITDPGSTSNGYEIRWDGTAREGDYAVGDESLGTLTVTAPTSRWYVCTDGAGDTWTHGDTGTLTFVYKCLESDEETFSHFTGIEVDGVSVSPTAYDAKSGSLVLTLKSSYLQGLSAGTHTLQPIFDDGAAQRVTFRVADASGAATNTDTSGSAAQAADGTTRTSSATQASNATRTGTTATTTVSSTPRTGDASSAWPCLVCVLGLATAALGIARRQ